jgi:hypothetical protein
MATVSQGANRRVILFERAYIRESIGYVNIHLVKTNRDSIRL